MSSVRAREAGFTLVELLIALVVGVVVLMSATGLVIATTRSLAGADVRDDLERDGRFIGVALGRDLQEAGVAIEATEEFGTVAAFGDTLVVLSVPFHDGQESPPYELNRTVAPGPYVAGQGTCGARCIDVTAPAGLPLRLEAGRFARLQVSGGARRLVYVTGVARSGTNARVTFADYPTLLGHRGAMSGGIQLGTGSFLQELRAVVYYRDGDRLLRATGLRADGTPDGEVIATGVRSFDVSLLFTDGDELPAANGTDADDTNDHTDLAGVRVRATLEARPDPRVNGGHPVTRTWEWRFMPRNLIYERNRG